MSAQIDTAALVRRIAVLDEIGVGPLWLRRDTVFGDMPVVPSSSSSSSQGLASASVMQQAPTPALLPPRPAPATRSDDDAAWDDGAMQSGIAAAPVKTISTLCTSADVSDTARYLFVARASSVQGTEELFDNILLALRMQKEAGPQGGSANLPAQITTHRPSVLIAMGPAAALQLIGDQLADDQNTGDENARFESLRGRLHRVGELPVLVTYDATHLLRNPGDKRKAWDDLCLLMRPQAADVADPA